MGFAAKSDGAKQGLEGESLLSEVPSGAYAYIGSPAFDTAGLGLSQQLRCALDSGGIPDVEDELGVSYDAILDLFAGGLGLYLRPAALIPEITLLLDPEDDAKSLDDAGQPGREAGPVRRRGAANHRGRHRGA